MSSIRVFISYSHDSDEHRDRVLGLSERLRQDGFDTQLDRYVNGTPSEGWPRWMMNGLDDAAFVLVVCTETYYRRFRGHEEPGAGKGVDWEGALITQEIYDARSDTGKFVPVMFDSANAEFVPEPIGSHTRYVLDSEPRYAELCDFLDGVAGVEPGEIGTRERKQRPRGQAATFGSDSSSGSSDRQIVGSRILRHAPAKLFGREPWLAKLDRMWEQRDSQHVFTLVAWGGVGKTSLIAHWVEQRFAAQNWPGVERYFDWSFYSQGTGESRQTSSDLFINRALTFFGDADPNEGGPWERGERLARLVRKHRTLLVLDGIEPLQYAEGDPSGQGGWLKDDGLAALLQGLAVDNPGLCVVTTREPLTNLQVYHKSTAPERKLDRLPLEAAIDLLRHLEIDGSDDQLKATWEETGGHALTIQLLGRYLADAHDGDIRKRDIVNLQEADRETQGRSAHKVMAAYERWFESAGVKGQRQLAILRLTGLFDGPISPDCLTVLRRMGEKSHRKSSGKWREIKEVFGPISKLTEAEWNSALKRLTKIDLIVLPSDTPSRSSATGFQPSIDAHPLIRSYFAERLSTRHPKAFQAAHSRLFDFLCESTPYRPDGLDGLQPLYQAVVHGCLAGRHQEACEKVYNARIQRGTDDNGCYPSRVLGAIGSDLSAVACFFDPPWSRLSANLHEVSQPWLFNEAALNLQALGRIREALAPLRASLELVEVVDFRNGAATVLANMSELEMELGHLDRAATLARESIDVAKQRPKEWRTILTSSVTAADVLHQGGDREEARHFFDQAESELLKHEQIVDMLYSGPGFRLCDLLLTPAEHAAWRTLLCYSVETRGGVNHEAALVACDEAIRRVTSAESVRRKVLSEAPPLLDAAMNNLTLSRATLYASILKATPDKIASLSLPVPESLCDAVGSMRRTGQIDNVPKCLLTAAVCFALASERERAIEALDETLQIARRGPMPLYHADALLTRARLFGVLYPQSDASLGPFSTGQPATQSGSADTSNESAGGNRPQWHFHVNTFRVL